MGYCGHQSCFCHWTVLRIGAHTTMRILFTTRQRNAVSTEINAANFARLGDLPGISIDFFRTDYARYDIVLFMGYDPDIETARAINPTAHIGIIDPRPSTEVHLAKADFIVVNGIEMQDWCANHCGALFSYPIYPSFPLRSRLHANRSPLVIGYHGNRVHIETMHPVVTKALVKLARERQVELRLLYNIDVLGQASLPCEADSALAVRHIQWTPEGYEEHMASADIGIMPMLLPMPDRIAADRRLWLSGGAEHPSDILLRYKGTSNAGRCFVFAQFGIPIIADMCPSALQLIRDGENGFVAGSVGAWYRALHLLSDSVRLRQDMAARMHETLLQRWSIAAINKQFVKFLSGLPASGTAIGDFRPSCMTSCKSSWYERFRSTIRVLAERVGYR